ncbi:hypothetical protein CKALI_11340 [Corynebacterium kalinowskii]|uniref:Terminase small subunit n=1 Tax=Corynebacterium kalinowskii TaxID=2675216 RepID=A0A6B8VD34_9CORY|nr:hypothetical protein [Corynebacterium kalinowskii]QGU03112.1 hypothetical protein CKALI_11340 [Corynebacterium kalinowskii]
MPGPIPKRSDQRRRRNKDTDGVSTVVAFGKHVATPPTEDRTWHIYAKNWFRSLKRSGQAQFYQESDWQEARMVALLISLEMKREHGPRAGMMDVIFSRADNLMTTEGARRRLRVELHNTKEIDDTDKSATVSVLAAYREEFQEGD